MDFSAEDLLCHSISISAADIADGTENFDEWDCSASAGTVDFYEFAEDEDYYPWGCGIEAVEADRQELQAESADT